MSQIVGNILGNAIKFTPERGRVTMRADASGNSVAIHVTDTGPGIAPGDIEHLFEHGGMIWVDSAPGRGSTFSFTLPSANGADHL